MPVLPLVGSTISDRPGSIRPSPSAASIIATPIRSLTEPPGLKYSSFAQTSASTASVRRRSATIGVLPTVSLASRAIRAPISVGGVAGMRLKLPPARSARHRARHAGQAGQRLAHLPVPVLVDQGDLEHLAGRAHHGDGGAVGEANRVDHVAGGAAAAGRVQAALTTAELAERVGAQRVAGGPRVGAA